MKNRAHQFQERNFLMNNEKGGIISKLFVIPVGIALMAGFFLLGYYVGKYKSKSAEKQFEQLPEVISKHLPKQEEFTFYKTLTEKDSKTVSIELKPAKEGDKEGSGKKEPEAAAPQAKDAKQQGDVKEREIEIKVDKTAPSGSPKKTALKPAQPRKETALTAAPNSKLRYTIQIASYPEKDPAEEEVKKMKKLGYAAFVAAANMEDKGTWYRVRLGSFVNRASAEKLVKELKTKEGISPIITIE